jgi:hypothetical protein
MAVPDYIFTEGFDKYGPPGEINIQTNIVAWGEWSSLLVNGSFSAITLVAALSGPGQALSIAEGGSSGNAVLSKTVPGNFPRIVGGYTFKVATLASGTAQGITFSDGGTDQLSIGINVAGQIEVRRGSQFAALIATSAQSVSAGSVNYLAYDVTFSAAAGIVKIWLNNTLTSINLTGQNTKVSANAYMNSLRIGAGTNVNAYNITFDHFYFWGFLAAGGSELPALTTPIIQTDFPNGDSAVAFTFGAGVLGNAFMTTTTTNAPGANRLSLRKYTPEVSGTLTAINLIPGATSAGVKNKPVLYSDSAGAPNTLLSTGSEVVGMTAGTALNLPLTTPQTVTAGTQYWLGFITDTSVALNLSDAGTLGYGAANTYTGGAPGTAPAMTAGLSSWLIWGTVTGVSSNWGQVDKNPALGTLSYNYSSTVGNEDLLTFPALAVTPTNIYSAAIKANVTRSDSGARTVDLRMKSGATTGSGNTTGISPALSPGIIGSYFPVDPNTGVTWAPSALNASTGGLKVAS